MGSIIKTVTFYKRPFWREKGTTSRMFYLNCLFSLEFRQIGTIFFFISFYKVSLVISILMKVQWKRGMMIPNPTAHILRLWGE